VYSLCTLCPLTVHSLSTHYPLPMHSLSTHYPLTIHSLSTHYPRRMRSWRNCSQQSEASLRSTWWCGTRFAHCLVTAARTCSPISSAQGPSHCSTSSPQGCRSCCRSSKQYSTKDPLDARPMLAVELSGAERGVEWWG
jgi:hypothetical protein